MPTRLSTNDNFPEDTWLGVVNGEGVWLDEGNNQNKRDLAALLEFRLLSRYNNPHITSGKFRDYPGFLLGACTSLMIESLQRYRMKFLADNTDGNAGNIFTAFFSPSDVLLEFRKDKTKHLYKCARLETLSRLEKNTSALNFYKHIRCGLLPVGESRSRWRLWRYSYEDAQTKAQDPFDDNLPICDPKNRIVFKDRLLVCLKNEVELACKAFAKGDEWDSFEKAMRKTCAVCKPGEV